METRYSDENIGEITDDEVIFMSGKRYLLKEIGMAIWRDDNSLQADNSLDLSLVLKILFLLFWDAVFIAIVVYSIDSTNCFLAFFMLILTFLIIVMSNVKLYGIIVLVAKNGDVLYKDRIGKKSETKEEPEGNRFVEQINRLITREGIQYRYTDEEIGNITADEVTFKSGKRYLLKEIRMASWRDDYRHRIAPENCILDLSVVIKFLFSFIFISGLISVLLMLFVNYPMYLFLLIIVFLSYAGLKLFLSAIPDSHGTIVLEAKNGDILYKDRIRKKSATEERGKQFVEQLNRYIG